MKNLIFLLVLLVVGLYTILFGIHTSSFTYMIGPSLQDLEEQLVKERIGNILTSLGVLTTSIALLLLWNRYVAKKHLKDI